MTAGPRCGLHGDRFRLPDPHRTGTRASRKPATLPRPDGLSEMRYAARSAGALLTSHSGDGALLLILARAADALVKIGADFDPVWVPPGK